MTTKGDVKKCLTPKLFSTICRPLFWSPIAPIQRVAFFHTEHSPSSKFPLKIIENVMREITINEIVFWLLTPTHWQWVTRKSIGGKFSCTHPLGRWTGRRLENGWNFWAMWSVWCELRGNLEAEIHHLTLAHARGFDQPCVPSPPQRHSQIVVGQCAKRWFAKYWRD